MHGEKWLECPGIYHKYGDCGFRTDHSVNVAVFICTLAALRRFSKRSAEVLERDGFKCRGVGSSRGVQKTKKKRRAPAGQLSRIA